MTDSDDKLLRRYRELSREEPPRALDDAILAASRRAVAKTSWSRRFAAPVSIAAVLVLAFGLTLEMRREEPGVEYTAPARKEPAVVPAMPAGPPVQAPQEKEEKRREPKPAAKPALTEQRIAAPHRPLKEPAPFAREARPAPEPFAPSPQSAPSAPAPSMDTMRDANVAPAAPPAPATATARAMAAPRAKAETSESAQAPSRANVAGGASAASGEPERELERIAKLREEHRDEEADKAFAEFKRKYPDFRIPDAMLARVKPR